MSDNEKTLLEQLAALRAENDKLKAAKERKVSFRVSEKQALSVYGLNSRFPVTLYAQQWEKLLDHAEGIRQFIAENNDKLSRKE